MNIFFTQAHSFSKNLKRNQLLLDKRLLCEKPNFGQLILGPKRTLTPEKDLLTPNSLKIKKQH